MSQMAFGRRAAWGTLSPPVPPQFQGCEPQLLVPRARSPSEGQVCPKFPSLFPAGCCRPQSQRGCPTQFLRQESRGLGQLWGFCTLCTSCSPTPNRCPALFLSGSSLEKPWDPGSSHTQPPNPGSVQASFCPVLRVQLVPGCVGEAGTQSWGLEGGHMQGTAEKGWGRCAVGLGQQEG